MSAQETRIYFELQRTAHLLKVTADDAMIAHAGVTTAQAAVLVLIAAKETARQNELAAALGQKEAAMTQMVAKLIERGLAKRTRDAADRRAWSLTLTAKGARAARAAQAAMAEINARLDGALTKPQMARLAKSLSAIRKALAGGR